MFDERLVVHHMDGTSVKGYGDPFLPGEKELLLQDTESGHIHRVALASVKLVCFVKAFVTDSHATHKPAPPLLYQAIPGRRVRVEFPDGEKIEGVASLSAPPKVGFFLTPLTPEGNNIQLYINCAATKRFQFLD